MNDLRSAGRLVKRSIGGDTVEVVEKEYHVLSYDPESRTGEIVASDETVDRYGDVIVASGWRLDAYRRNPVMLIDHDYSVMSMVGTCDPKVSGKALVTRFVLDDPATNRNASIVANLIKNRTLRAVSVGFVAHAYDRITDNEGNWTGGFKYTDVELLEISWVAVPANPSCVMSITETGESAASSDDGPVLIAARALALAGKE